MAGASSPKYFTSSRLQFGLRRSSPEVGVERSAQLGVALAHGPRAAQRFAERQARLELRVLATLHEEVHGAGHGRVGVPDADRLDRRGDVRDAQRARDAERRPSRALPPRSCPARSRAARRAARRATGSRARGRLVTTMLRAGSSSIAEVHALSLRSGVALMPPSTSPSCRQQHRDRLLPARNRHNLEAQLLQRARSPRAPRARSPATRSPRRENHTRVLVGGGQHSQAPARPDLGEIGCPGGGRAPRSQQRAPRAPAAAPASGAAMPRILADRRASEALRASA